MQTYKVYKFTIKQTDKNLSNVKTTDRPAYNMLKLTIKQTDKTKQLNYREKKQTDRQKGSILVHNLCKNWQTHSQTDRWAYKVNIEANRPRLMFFFLKPFSESRLYLTGSLGSQCSQSGQRPGATESTRAPTYICINNQHGFSHHKNQSMVGGLCQRGLLSAPINGFFS